EQILLAGQTADGAWYKLANGAWIAAFLIDAPASQPPVVAPEAAGQAEDISLLEALSGAATAEAPAPPDVAPVATATNDTATNNAGGEQPETDQTSS
ncbi:MAG TPA: hypothetical protein PL187_05675, partial [Caldilinea sp.]|nr:hypothetical protein [Caldilinea sp.]